MSINLVINIGEEEKGKEGGPQDCEDYSNCC